MEKPRPFGAQTVGGLKVRFMASVRWWGICKKVPGTFLVGDRLMLAQAGGRTVRLDIGCDWP